MSETYFVEREGGNIVALYGCPQDGLTEPEPLPATHPEVLDFLAPSPPVSAPVSRAQGQMALYNAGLLDQLEAIIAAHPYRPVSIWYASANHWERGHPYVQALALDMGLTDEQVDALFAAAALVRL